MASVRGSVFFSSCDGDLGGGVGEMNWLLVQTKICHSLVLLLDM